MEKVCGNITGGWMRVANKDMRNLSNTCPNGLTTLEVSSKRLCSMNIDGAGCSSINISVQSVCYSKVCGKITGYQQKTPDAFEPYNRNPELTIDGYYVNEISLTHGCNPRNYIWTFAAAAHEQLAFHRSICPCSNRHNTQTIHIPPYVGNDYFCDTASRGHFRYIFYPDDPLWDGQGCGPNSDCCSFNNTPWFSKQLNSSTTDDIEMRLCANQPRSDEDITFEQLELYVQ